MHMYSIPNELKNQNVLLYTDNEALTAAWSKKTAKNSEIGTILLQILTKVELLLECRIFIRYQPRRSTPELILVDNLSRSNTTTLVDLQTIQHLEQHKPAGPLIDWLQEPETDWDLSRKVINWMKNVCNI